MTQSLADRGSARSVPAARGAARSRCGEIDRRIGRRIADLRASRGLSQSALGEAIGVSFQQVQKYERGRNRIAAARLPAIALALDVSLLVFFAEDDAAEGGDAAAAAAPR